MEGMERGRERQGGGMDRGSGELPLEGKAGRIGRSNLEE